MTNSLDDLRLDDMGAVVCDGVGGPEVMSWGRAPMPVPAADEVVVRIAATAVNRADLSQRAGRYPVPPSTSPILGLECSGWIHSIGDQVSGFEMGEAVMALIAGGAYAEFVSVPAAQLMRVPAGVALCDAAALPEALCTVYSNLVIDGGLRAGQTVLIHGGGSGIGTFAIQAIRAAGARPFVTVGSEKKAEQCLELGAEAAINYKTHDFAAEVRSLTDGRGVDLLLDCIGGPYLARNLDALADDGTMLIIGLQGGLVAEADLNALMRRRLTVRGSTLRARPADQKAKIVDRSASLIPLIEAGTIAPTIARRFAVTEAAEAHRYVEAGENFGKVVLIVCATSDDRPRC